MTLSLAGVLDRTTVVRAADVVADLVARPEVAAAWTQESSCAGMSVGGLAWHLANQTIKIVGLLNADESDGAGAPTIELLEHYERAAWVREDNDGDANRSIRDAGNAEAAQGPADALSAMLRARAELEQLLVDPSPTTYVPWQDWALATDDFMVTRLMEMVVHSDDLAASVDLPAPDFGLDILDPVLRLLAALAVRRHGEAALVRTLARPQRAPATVSAF